MDKKSLLFVHLSHTWPDDLGFHFKINSILMSGLGCLEQVLKNGLLGALSCPDFIFFLLISQQHFLRRGTFGISQGVL